RFIRMDEHWNAFRSHKRGGLNPNEPPLPLWMIKSLQLTKFVLFLIAHIFIVAASFFSRIFLILLSTNILPSHHSDESHYEKTCHIDVHRLPKARAASMLVLFLIQCLPDFLALLQSLHRFLTDHKSGGRIRMTLIFFESCRSSGLLLLYLYIFPTLDSFRALFALTAVQFLPTFQSMVGVMARSFNDSFPLARRLSILISSVPHFLITMLIASSAYIWSIGGKEFDRYLILPLALLLFSLGFWEAWITPNHAGSYFHHLYQIKYGIRKVNSPTRITLSIIRISIGLFIFSHSASSTIDLKADLFRKVLTSWSFSYSHTRILLLGLGVLLLNYSLRVVTRLLAAMSLHLPSLLHPLTISIPLSLLASHLMCNVFTLCSLGKTLAKIGITYRCVAWHPSAHLFSDVYLAVVWLLVSLYRSHALVSPPDFDKSDEVIESMPAISNGLAIDQSLVVFEHSLAKNDTAIDDEDDPWMEANVNDPLRIRSDELDKVSTLYVCATMWHETRTEMTQMFKSLLKLDEERAVCENKKRKDDIQFRLEVHIFFDDAWEDQSECGRTPNQFFRLFFDLINEMTEKELSADDDEEGGTPTRMLVNTSYGGRLVVRLPAGTLMFVHLKDKKLIRHKKRWSQVMYMYYLLGHRIMDSHLSIEDKQLAADNTFILAIDGDSKFEPEAVLRLLHLMQMKSDIGCACGRIHPIGNGVMVWYQKFEYAIAHWFQKAAEHVLGCVLCAPGCFSLFRASALMDDNIMHKYTKTASEPRHFVQYDQGEDRWLSTLMLKQGYRIEYVAASDAETYAPEGFEEFFNQRRRWTPSSVANTVDLLADYKRALANNNSMSFLYILYQFIVIGFSMLGPGIIFSMLVFAQVAAFGVDSTSMMMYNAIPILLYISTCFVMESSVQLFFAKILSIIYAFVMLAVLVATTSQIIMESVLAPTSLFIVTMVGIFAGAALLHPQECSNIVHGTIFFLLIPSTYVFLSLYSLINLNVINWGTREAVAKAMGKAPETSASEKWIRRMANSPLGKVFLPSMQSESDPHVEALERRLEMMDKKMTEMQKEKKKDEVDAFDRLRTLSAFDESFYAKENEVKEITSARRFETSKDSMNQRGVNRLQWMDAEYLQVCERGRLKASEERFWDQLIDTYLKPQESSAREQADIAEGLASLRNNIAFAIILLNGLLVLAIFLIQRNKEILSFQWTLTGGLTHVKMNPMTGKYEETDEPLEVDPLGMGIIVFLSTILIVQTVGMIIHRVTTLFGAFQELNAMQEACSHSPTKRDDDDLLLEAARSMVDTSNYSLSHGADGFTRATGDTNNVLYKLQRARLTQRLQRGAVEGPE
ncbi:hypothetical protein PMAYCL1PPCAC_17835, partial [Pristionchus mayeri]